MRPIFSGSARPVASVKERAVPVRRTEPGMMLKAVPPWIEPIVTTAASSGEISRETDRLQRLDDARGRDDRIGRLVGRRAVPAAALDLDLEVVDGGHQRAAVDADLADGQGAPEVEAESGAHALEHAVVRARLRSSLAFLGRLEEEAHGRVGLLRGEQAGDGERHRHVAVVSAGVHAARDRRGVGLFARFLQGQRIHVRAQHDARASRAVVGHDTGPSDPRARCEADLAQPIRDDAGRAVLLEGELGVAVQVAARGDEGLVLRGWEVSEEVVEGHRGGIIGSRGESGR